MNKCLVKLLNNQIKLVYYLRSFVMVVFLFLLNVVCFMVNAYIGFTEYNTICMLVSAFNLGAAVLLLSDMIGDWK